MARDSRPKKEKIIYVDDGSTIADMSATKPSDNENTSGYASRYRASFKEQFRTYCDAVIMMFLPMLVVIGFLCVLFLILYLIF